MMRLRAPGASLPDVGPTIGNVLPLGVGVALSPLPIVGVILMLATPRARANGLGFVAGWIVGLALVGVIVLLASDGAGASDQGEPKTWVGVLKLVLGAALVLLAVREWRTRPRGDEEGKLPSWMSAIDTFTATRATALGFALSALNPKNLALALAAGATIAQAGLPAGQQAVVLAVFVVVGTLGPGLPVAVYLLAGRGAEHRLAEMRTWMTRNNTAIMAVLCLVIGAKLLGDGLAALTG